MIENGTISALVKTGNGGLDENGNPVAPSSYWADPIPCYIEFNENNYKGFVNGNTFTVASYTILIDDIYSFNAEQVHLHLNGDVLGEFSIVGKPEPNSTFCCVKILV